MEKMAGFTTSINLIKKSIPLYSANSSRKQLHLSVSHPYEATPLRNEGYRDNSNHISLSTPIPHPVLAFYDPIDPLAKSPQQFPSAPTYEPSFPFEMPRIHAPEPEVKPVRLDIIPDPPRPQRPPPPKPDFPGPPIPSPPIPDIPPSPPDIFPPRPPDILPPPSTPPEITPLTGPFVTI